MSKTTRLSFPVNLLTLSLLSSLMLGCSKDEPPPASTTTAKPRIAVKIGHVAPMTGPQAHQGADNRNGALMAIEEINAAKPEIGGAEITFVLMAEDDQADPKQGTVVAQKLVDEGVSGVIGHLNSGTTLPASRIYFDAGIPQISGSATNPAYTQQGYATAFRVMTNDVQQGKALGVFAGQQGFKTVALVDDRTAYGQGLVDEFRKSAEANGIKVLTAEFTTDKSTDFKAILTKIKAQKPDLVFFGGMDAQGGPLLKQMRELGLKSKFLGGDGVCTPEFINLAGGAAEGEFCSQPGTPINKLEKGRAFLEKYLRSFGIPVQNYAPYVYDAVYVMVDAMKRANSTQPSKYLPEIGKTRLEGVTATIEFDAKGDLKNTAVSLYRYRADKLEHVTTVGGNTPSGAQGK